MVGWVVTGLWWVDGWQMGGGGGHNDVAEQRTVTAGGAWRPHQSIRNEPPRAGLPSVGPLERNGRASAAPTRRVRSGSQVGVQGAPTLPPTPQAAGVPASPPPTLTAPQWWLMCLRPLRSSAGGAHCAPGRSTIPYHHHHHHLHYQAPRRARRDHDRDWPAHSLSSPQLVS